MTLLAKSLLQTLWRTKINWDEKPAEAELKEWRRWKNALPALAIVKIPRCYKTTNSFENHRSNKGSAQGVVKNVKLHNFSDAGEVGYGTAWYIRTEFSDGTVTCLLAFGKARTAPFKKDFYTALGTSGSSIVSSNK